MIVISLEGGLIQSVSSDEPAEVGKEIVVIDYDSEGADPEEVSLIPQDDDTTEEAIVSRQEIGLIYKPISNFLHAELKKDGHDDKH